MIHTIFDKTAKGRDEIATRKHRLPSRLRTLLLLVDGKQDAASLLQKVRGLGMKEENLAELLEQGFIREAYLPPHCETGAADQNPQFDAIYRFYTDTIKSTIGLRGYALQLQVEKALSVEDLLALRKPYFEAVEEAQGEEVACVLRDRLDRLLLSCAYPHLPPNSAAGAVVLPIE